MSNGKKETSLSKRIKFRIIGRPRNINDPLVFHKISLIALLSWIGLGADGLSSSAYGPAEGYSILSGHVYLSVFLAAATALTIFVISFTYSKIIEQFPHGGGGYIVATHTLGKHAGVISGSSLLVDYTLTITVSLAACGDAIFSFLPSDTQHLRLLFKCVMIILFIIMNLRGVKESITILAPIFLLFIFSHILLLGYGILIHVPSMSIHAQSITTGLQTDLSTIGLVGVLALLLKAFSYGAGTYTGLEAVSNGLPIMREPRVNTGKKTMLYMAVSLSLIATGLFLCYFLMDIQPDEKGVKTLNAILATSLFKEWPYGELIAFIVILSEGLLLAVAAQTGFIDGPRVMANMAKDSWLPKKFSALSERLVMQNGVLVMGVAALGLMLITKGDITYLVTMYAINVFLTFSLSELGMAKLSLKQRRRKPKCLRRFIIFSIGFVICFSILITMIYYKLQSGGWLTIILTSFVIVCCYLIHRHYAKVRKAMHRFDESLLLSNIHLADKPNDAPVNPKDKTAVLLVNGYNGFGVNTLLTLVKNFPGLYKNIVFVSIAEIDSGAFKGVERIKELKESVDTALSKYVKLARKLGFASDSRMDTGTDVVEAATQLCEHIAEEFPNSTFFTGKIVFKHETIFHKLLHNETAFAIQRRLQWKGLPVVILPLKADI